MTTFSALFPSAYESVADARQAVGAFAQGCGFSRSEVSDIVLAVGEACGNAAEHGHVDHGHFTVGCVYEDGVLKAEIMDGGGGFDPDAVEIARAPADWLGRGRGIPIMRALMDRVTYRITSTGTTVVLEKRKLASSFVETASEFHGLDAGSRG